MKAKKITALLLAATMTLATVLAGCGDGGSSSSDDSSTTTDDAADDDADTSDDDASDSSDDSASSGDSIEVTFWALATRQDAIEPIVESFMAENPDVTVTVSFYDTDGIKDACKVAASSGTMPSMWFNWGGSLGSFYVENGVTYDLTEYAEENGWYDNFSSGALNLCTLDGKLAGYPTSYNVLNMYYRKDIFEENGLDVPTTFEEFEEVCATLKENGVTPISTAGLNGWHVMRFVEQLVEYYAGAELHDQLNTFEESWENDAVVQALTKYQEFCENGYFPDGFVTASPDDTLMALMTGECAMDIQGQWYDNNIIVEGGDLENFGTFPIPTTGTNRVSAFAEMTQFNANLTDAELEACMRFTDYYYSDEIVEQYSEYYNLPLPKVGAEAAEGQINVPIMMEAAEQNGTFTITDQAFPTEIADGLFDVQDAIANGQMTPEEGAAAIQAAIDSYHE